MTDQREALREALLDIGTDHEGHRLRVDRADPDPELGPGHWLLVCDTDDESLLDFAALPSTPQPEGLDGRAVHAAWRDGMLAQGREVAPERMSWDTLDQRDRDLDDGIAARLAPPPPTGGSDD